MAVEGVHQPGQFGQGVTHLATGTGADPQAVIDVHQSPPAVPFGLGAPKRLVATRFTCHCEHGLQNGQRHRPES